jgi:uncharacterized protein (TIGR03067 family)
MELFGLSGKVHRTSQHLLTRNYLHLPILFYDRRADITENSKVRGIRLSVRVVDFHHASHVFWKYSLLGGSTTPVGTFSRMRWSAECRPTTVSANDTRLTQRMVMTTRSIVTSFKTMVLALGALVFGTGTAVPADDKESKSLNGTWQVVSQWTDGKQEAIPKDGGDMVTLNDGKYTIKEGDKDICKGSFKLDSSKSPMSIDKTMSEGDDKGKTALGIFQLTGDEVKLAWSRAGETDRPAGFEAKSYRVTTLKRIKT